MTFDEQVAHTMAGLGVSESTAREIVAIEQGLSDGDVELLDAGGRPIADITSLAPAHSAGAHPRD